MSITLEDLKKMSEAERSKIVAAMIRPKRCGGLGVDTCSKCGERKHTYEKRRPKPWVCVECRVAEGAYERYCDGCYQKKPAKHAPYIRWHWWCDDCVTPEREEYMKNHERTR